MKTTRKIVAIGGGEIGIRETAEVDKRIIELTGKTQPKALFIPTASGDASGYMDTFTEISSPMKIPSIVIIGDDSQAGTYILRIRLQENTTLRFGRFKKGKLISLPAGDYTYVGSALSEKGSTSLARRLVRHATRSGDKPPHAIRKSMIDRFAECCLGPRDPLPKSGKTLFWNVDFLLDLPIAEIVNIIAIRSPERLEYTIAVLLEHDAETQIIEKGLGANDAPRNTHILRTSRDESWWSSVADRIQENFSNQVNTIN